MSTPRDEPGHAMRCPQCGFRYVGSMNCGPTHALISGEIQQAPHLSALIVREREIAAEDLARVTAERDEAGIRWGEHYNAVLAAVAAERDRLRAALFPPRKQRSAVGDRVTATLRGTLTDYDPELGVWTLTTDGADHVPWQIHLHWAQPFVALTKGHGDTEANQ